MKTKDRETRSFFAQFPVDEIFKLWNSSTTLLDIAQKFSFRDPNGLDRADYEYIESIKTREIWQQAVKTSRKKERERYQFISNLSAEELTLAMNLPGIETISHLALHYLVSAKHGRSAVKNRILTLKLDVKSSFYKGIYGVSETPQYWPTKYYESRVGPKPMVCPICSFKAIKPQQIELHHPEDIDRGTKDNRNLIYYRTKDLKPMCANCHSLKHRTGERLMKICGQWHIKSPENQKYKDPSLIFSANCSETYRLQKVYYLKWYLTNADQYKCQQCGVSHWGLNEERKLLSLELHHKDNDRTNSLISNLELLCPNCHRMK